MSKFLNPSGKQSMGLQSAASCRVALLAVVCDFEFFQRHGANVQANIISAVNQVDGIYTGTFNMRMRLSSTEVFFNSNDPFTTNDANGLLDQFRNWFNTNRGGVNRDIAHLLTGRSELTITVNQQVISGVLGVARFNTAGCNLPQAYSVTLDRVGYVETFAHELGHNFGAVHPNEIPNNTECVGARPIMCQGTPKQLVFSPSSVQSINAYVNNNSGCFDTGGGPEARIIAPEAMCVGNTYEFKVANPVDNLATFEWSSNSPNFHISGISPVAYVVPQVPGFYVVKLTANNACGKSHNEVGVHVDETCYSDYKIYPNPAADQVYVEFENVSKKEKLPDEISLYSEQSTKLVLKVSPQQVFEEKTFKDGKKIELNVKGIPRGVYYLKISNNRKKGNELDVIRILLH